MIKYFGWFIGLFITGFMFGLIFFGGATYEMKKSLKSQIPMEVPLVVGLVCGVIGLIVAYNIAEDDSKREKLGLNNISSNKYKVGRKWNYESSWTDPTTNEACVVKTYYDSNLDATVTSFNDQIILNHNSNSGAEPFVSKAHTDTRYQIIKDILAKYKS